MIQSIPEGRRSWSLRSAEAISTNQWVDTLANKKQKAGRQTALSSLDLLYIWAVAGRSAPLGEGLPYLILPGNALTETREAYLILDPSKLAIKINSHTLPPLVSWPRRK